MQLQELKRSQVLSSGKQSDEYAPDNREYGKNRYSRRLKQKVSRSTAEYNKMDMHKLFTEGILDVNILVHGESDDYTVRVAVQNIIEHFQTEIQKEEKVSRRAVLRALISALNKEDIQVRCTCPDSVYR